MNKYLDSILHLIKRRKLPFIFIDDLLMTGLALDLIFTENVEINSPKTVENVENVENIENVERNCSKIVELFDWSSCFLTMHTSETEKLLDARLAYYSPMLIVAFNLTPGQVTLIIFSNFFTLIYRSTKDRM